MASVTSLPVEKWRDQNNLSISPFSFTGILKNSSLAFCWSSHFYSNQSAIERPGFAQGLVITVTFFSQWKCNAIIQFAEFCDLLIGSFFLLFKIIGRKTDDHQLVLIFFIQFLKIIILIGIPTIGSCIYK